MKGKLSVVLILRHNTAVIGNRVLLFSIIDSQRMQHIINTGVAPSGCRYKPHTILPLGTLDGRYIWRRFPYPYLKVFHPDHMQSAYTLALPPAFF